MASLRIGLSAVAVSALLAGCSLVEDETCLPPPIVDCKTFQAPQGGFPAGVTERQAVAIAIGIRNCTSAIGESTAAIRRMLGKPVDKENIGMGADRVQVWYPIPELQIVAQYAGRKTTMIQIRREYGDSGVPPQYCGEPGATP